MSKPYPFRGRFDLSLVVLEVYSEPYDITLPNGTQLSGHKPVMRCSTSDMADQTGGDTEVRLPVPTAFLFNAVPGTRAVIRATWDGNGRGKRPHLVKDSKS